MKRCDNCFNIFPEEELEYYLGKFLCETCRTTCQVCKKQKKLNQLVILCSSNPMLEGTTVYCRTCYHKILKYLHCPKCESENITMTINNNQMEITCKDCKFKKNIKI
ncbi:MAG: hypothetical protein ACTSO9_11890 [Candidatus Helarchaeota archaeon]